MENRACHPGNGERQKRTDSAVRKPKSKPTMKRPLYGLT